jgi:UMF1 family MFS transporter
VVVCLSAWQVQTENQFFVIAGLVGLVMGGSQSMMRSTFTRFLPHQEKGKAALYGFFDLLDKFSTVLGTLVFGLVNQLVGTMRVSALVLTVFFVLGAFFLKTLHPPTSEKNETA